jgi:hypothetical protein
LLSDFGILSTVIDSGTPRSATTWAKAQRDAVGIERAGGDQRRALVRALSLKSVP